MLQWIEPEPFLGARRAGERCRGHGPDGGVQNLDEDAGVNPAELGAVPVSVASGEAKLSPARTGRWGGKVQTP